MSPTLLLPRSPPVLVLVSPPILDPSVSDVIKGEDAVMKDGCTICARAPPVNEGVDTDGSYALLEEGVAYVEVVEVAAVDPPSLLPPAGVRAGVPVGDVSGEPVLGLRRKPEKKEEKKPPFACLEADVVVAVVPACVVALAYEVEAEVEGEGGTLRPGESNTGRTTATGATAGEGICCAAPLLAVPVVVVVVIM